MRYGCVSGGQEIRNHIILSHLPSKLFLWFFLSLFLFSNILINGHLFFFSFGLESRFLEANVKTAMSSRRRTAAHTYKIRRLGGRKIKL